MLIKSWLRGPWWDADGVKHDGPVEGKLLPTDNPKHLGIIGIVDCVVGSSVGQGFTPRGIPLYLCYPLRQDYPPFLVAVKEKYVKPPIVSMNLEHWNDKWPRGGIQRVLGFVGDSVVEREAVIRSLTLPRNKEINISTPTLTEYDASAWDMVCNIDPDGCQDVDDILCWRTKDNGDVEFAIGIADVSAFIEEDSTLDVEASLRASTLYDDGTAVDPMLPTTISAGCASLLADGVARPVLALVYVVNGQSVVSSRWERICTRVHKAYTYDTVDEHIDFLSTTISLIVGYDVGVDTHNWIEAVMVLYNYKAAELLQKEGLGILRVHQGVERKEWIDLAQTTGCSELAFFGSRGGLYVSGDYDGSVSHSGLNLPIYCHASSPLRRYADLVNQRCLKHILFGAPRPLKEINVDALNHRCEAIKSCERLLWFLKTIVLNEITLLNGYVIDITNRTAKVYCPGVKKTFKTTIPDENIVMSQKIHIKLFCDLKRCNLAERYVIQINVN